MCPVRSTTRVVRPDERIHVGIGADRDDLAVTYGGGLGPGVPGVHRVDAAVTEHDIGGLRHAFAIAARAGGGKRDAQRQARDSTIHGTPLATVISADDSR